ncbi:hypothetical protein [Shinella sp.]|uniref:hypothetical protein n=1 Tax=Shinella sp. TaxID=1870904 RepID=UPI00301DC6CB
MADFVAVIRRAVDGLSDNNAEMRQKVYEKARGAVRRQLESMNPRPSDELMKRQLDKLETAILNVESDHAEALPAEEPVPEPVEAAVPVAPPAEEPTVEEPVAEEPVAVAEPEPWPAEPEPAPYEEPITEHRAEEGPFAEPAAEELVAEEPVAGEPFAEEPVVQQPVLDEPAAGASVEESAEEPVSEPVAWDEPAREEAVTWEEPVREEPVVVEAHSEPSWRVAAEPAEDYVPSWQEPVHDVAAEAGDETVEVNEPEPQAYPVHDEEAPEAEPVAEARMPASEAQWDWNEAAAATITGGSREQAAAVEPDPLAWEWPDEKASRPAAGSAEPAKKSDWDDLDDLVGFTPKAEPSSRAATSPAPEAAPAGAAASPAGVEAARAPQQRSFRAEPRKSRFNLGALVATVALLAIVGGAGAAYWFNRDSVNGWVNEKIASFTAPSAGTPAETTPTTDTTDGGASTAPVGTAPAADTASSGTAGNTEIASAAQNASGKFTQRLLTDGSEVDAGPAAALDGGAAEEGKSVAAQSTETASAEGGATTDGQAPAAGAVNAPQVPAGAATTDTQTPAATGNQAAAVGATQKMFLYEERLGQTSPTAIEGTVAWSSAEESPGGDAKPEPVVRAQINVPSKGLTALVTFRRNADKSLPASHIIELVFSLPENFEGGGIESVQRVAMKRNEQDRGDALIAVPAKITDDFHMIALNDFPEAIAKNTELLRTRGWIDIPITYRNGRRALLTLDKGTAGAEAFDTVMKAWATAGGQ